MKPKILIALAFAVGVSGCVDPATATALVSLSKQVVIGVVGQAAKRKISERAPELAEKAVLPALAESVAAYCSAVPAVVRAKARAAINDGRENLITVECEKSYSRVAAADSRAIDWPTLFSESLWDRLSVVAPELGSGKAVEPAAAVAAIQKAVDRYCQFTDFVARAELRSALKKISPAGHLRIDCRSASGIPLPF